MRKMNIIMEESSFVIKRFKEQLADALVLVAKEAAVVKGVIDRLINIGRCCGMQINAG